MICNWHSKLQETTTPYTCTLDSRPGRQTPLSRAVLRAPNPARASITRGGPSTRPIPPPFPPPPRLQGWFWLVRELVRELELTGSTPRWPSSPTSSASSSSALPCMTTFASTSRWRREWAHSSTSSSGLRLGGAGSSPLRPVVALCSAPWVRVRPLSAASWVRATAYL